MGSLIALRFTSTATKGNCPLLLFTLATSTALALLITGLHVHTVTPPYTVVKWPIQPASRHAFHRHLAYTPSSGTIDNSIVARQSLLLRDSPLNLQAIEDGPVPRSLPLVWRGYLLVVYGPREKSCQCGREKLGTLMIEMKFIGLVIPDGESGWINRYQRVHAGSLCGHRHLTDGIHGRRSRRDKKDQLGPVGLT